MMSAIMRRASRASAAQVSKPDPVAETVRTKLLALGDFAHLHVCRQAEHVVIEHVGPEASDDHHPILRLTPIGGFRFGLSLRRHTDRWEKIPVSGALADVLATAVSMFGPWLAPEPPLRGTSEMDY